MTSGEVRTIGGRVERKSQNPHTQTPRIGHRARFGMTRGHALGQADTREDGREGRPYKKPAGSRRYEMCRASGASANGLLRPFLRRRILARRRLPLLHPLLLLRVPLLHLLGLLLVALFDLLPSCFIGILLR